MEEQWNQDLEGLDTDDVICRRVRIRRITRRKQSLQQSLKAHMKFHKQVNNYSGGPKF